MNPQVPVGPVPPNTPNPYQQPPSGQAEQPQPPYQPGPQAPIQSQLPQQQYGNPEHQQYDFIMNRGQAAARSFALPGSNSKLGRIALVAGIGVVLIILIAVVMSFLNRPTISSVELVNAAQEQSELIRIAGIAANDQSAAQSTRNSAQTIQLSLGSAQSDLLGYLALNHIKIGKDVLQQRKDAQTDTELTSAQTAGTFDSTYAQIMQSQLTAYQQTLKAAYAAHPGPRGQKLLSDDYQAAGLLLVQLQQQ
ncbi:MAG TPA: hypothetical protein VFH39_04330 [Candidatus Saccharimonadales bacterium]|nr:hypothetical protein [Candidatus Saccharimonadales bacterium]